MIDPVYFFCGVDPAPSESQKSDDGAIMVAAAQPKQLPPRPEPGRPRVGEEDWVFPVNEADWHFDFVYARRLTWRQKASARQWSGILHDLHRRFGFAQIGMDPNQGGVLIAREMLQPRQIINSIETTVIPIADAKEGPHLVARGEFILILFKRGDPGIEALWPKLRGDDLLNDSMYSHYKESLDQTLIGWPARMEDWMGDPARRAELERWPEERLWALKNLHASTEQTKNIVVAMTPDQEQFLMTRNRARQFSSVGKKDFVSAGMICRVAFLSWLKGENWRGQVAPEDSKLFAGW